MADVLLNIKCTLNKFFLKRSLEAYRDGSGLRAEAWEFGEIERGAKILCAGACSGHWLLLVFFPLRWLGRLVVGVYVGAGNGGKEKGRGMVEGWTPGPHNCHAPGGWSCFEKSPSMTEEEGESCIYAVLLSLIVGSLRQVRRTLEQKEAESLFIVLLLHVSRLYIFATLTPEHLF
jgi:hypothetical protein